MSTKRPLSELSIPELLQRARAEEEGALEELFRQYKSKLEELARRHASLKLTGNTRPSDIAQDAALRAFQRFSSFKGNSEGEWVSWLKHIVFSQFVRTLREARSQKRDASGTVPLDNIEAQTVAAPQRSPSQVTSHQEEWRQLLASLYLLPDDQREALSLHRLKELSIAEVAKRMGRSEAAVESLMQRGVRTLRSRMAGRADVEPESSAHAAAATNAADAAFLVYLRRREAGETVDPETFAAGYPECAEELRGLLHWMERLRALRPSGS